MKIVSSKKKIPGLIPIPKRELEEGLKPVYYGIAVSGNHRWIVYKIPTPEIYGCNWVLHKTYWEAYAEMLRAEKGLPVRAWDKGRKVMCSADVHSPISEGWHEEYEEISCKTQ